MAAAASGAPSSTSPQWKSNSAAAPVPLVTAVDSNTVPAPPSRNLCCVVMLGRVDPIPRGDSRVAHGSRRGRARNDRSRRVQFIRSAATRIVVHPAPTRPPHGRSHQRDRASDGRAAHLGPDGDLRTDRCEHRQTSQTETGVSAASCVPPRFPPCRAARCGQLPSPQVSQLNG